MDCHPVSMVIMHVHKYETKIYEVNRQSVNSRKDTL